MMMDEDNVKGNSNEDDDNNDSDNEDIGYNNDY